MMPLAPTSAEFPTAHKPKMGFSIEAIVGVLESKEKTDSSNSTPAKTLTHHRSHSSSSLIENEKLEKNSLITEPSSMILATTDTTFPPRQEQRDTCRSNAVLKENIPGIERLSHGTPNGAVHREHMQMAPTSREDNKSITPSDHNIHRTKGITNPNQSPTSSLETARSQSPSNDSSKCSPTNSPLPRPIGIPAISVPISPSHGHSFQPPGLSIGGLPSMGLPHFPVYPSGMINFAAAAAAAATRAHHPGIPGWMHTTHPPPHHFHSPAAAHALYPWLLAKQGRFFPNRFGPGPDLPGFLLQPFRKPKRIRTAFNPSQLLKLEHAFERNHYVVGAERKQLANSLSLSETQVKVWFQNRRTKHKRMQQEEESVKKCGGSSINGNGPGSSHSSPAISADSSTRNFVEEISDDEEIVMDEEYSDDEESMKHS